jgi:hypothetical protein
MTISRKPKTEQATAKNVDVDALINKGGSIAQRQDAELKEKPVILRVPEDVLERIDATVKARRIKTPRHTWLLEAVLEKLEKESV